MCACVCVSRVIVRILHNFQHFTQNFVAANLRKFMQLKVFSRIGLVRGQRGAIVCVCVCADLMSGLIGNTLIFKHTHTHAHINYIF